jgi:uncharacterized metal-binding protein YceD (DUF177 family)
VKALKEFDIAFSGLANGKHNYQFKVDKRFFEVFEYADIEDAKLQIEIVLNKLSTFFELDFSIKGELYMACDVCTDMFWQPISSNKQIVVKSGEEFNDDNDELIVIPKADNHINVAQYVFEQIILAIPSRVVHPEGECNQEMIESINKYRIHEEKNDIDPRWAGLKNLN